MLKRRPFLKGLLSLPLLGSLVRVAESATEQPPAFEPGEELKYSLGWQFIVAGHARLEVLPDSELDGRRIRNFRMTARTNKIADALYKVRDTMTSTTTYDVSRSLGFTKSQREGDTRKEESIEFDWDNLKAHYHDSLSGSRHETDILENTLDPLSAFYFIRNQNLEVGTVVEGPMTDGKKCKVARIEVIQRKRIKVNGRRYDALKLVPDLKDVGGVFKKSKDAKLEIWCTADHRHIPVLLKSEVAVGSFKVELESRI